MTGRGEGRNCRIWRKGGVGRDRENKRGEGGRKRREGKGEKKNQDKHKRSQRFLIPPPLHPSPLCRGGRENSRCGFFPLALGVQGTAPAPRRSPGGAARAPRSRSYRARVPLLPRGAGSSSPPPSSARETELPRDPPQGKGLPRGSRACSQLSSTA